MLRLRHRHDHPDTASEDDQGAVITTDRRATDPTLVDERYQDERAERVVRDERDAHDTVLVREPRPAVVDETVTDTLPPPPAEAGVRVEQVVTETTFSPGQVVIMLAGAALLALGIAALVEGGLGGSMTEPVVELFDFDHTPALGLIEAATGVVLLVTGLTPAGRALAGLVGALLVAGGIVVLAEIAWVQDELAAEQDFGWVPIVIGAVTLLAAFALPATSRRRVTVVR